MNHELNANLGMAAGHESIDAGLTAQQLDDEYNVDGDGEQPEFTRANWREAVRLENTISGYWQWVEYQLRTERVLEVSAPRRFSDLVRDLPNLRESIDDSIALPGDESTLQSAPLDDDKLVESWLAAGYEIEDDGDFVPCASKVVGSVRFHITDLEGTGLPDPDGACLVNAYDAKDHQFLELYQEFPNRAALEMALPDLVVKAVANRS